jgi:tetratricopeptide (TPR) repeat protein
MAAVDPYSPCPCGSGQKFKWCCHKVESYADRANRLFENGQTEAALEVLDEGLRKEPNNAWLLTRKAFYLIRTGQLDGAKAALRLVVGQHRQHIAAHILLTRLVLETEGPGAGAAQFQQAAAELPAEHRAALASVVASHLNQYEEYPAALGHLDLMPSLTGSQETSQLRRRIERDDTIGQWRKASYSLSPAPEGLPPEAHQRFEQALQWAAEGLWAAAASAFEVLSAEQPSIAVADRNLGFCRLWMADDSGAVQALRRYIRTLGTSEEAVDLEALCQQCDPVSTDELVDLVRLIWPLRDRERLLRNLRADARIVADEPEPIDPGDENSPQVDVFLLLDRPQVSARSDLRPDEMPVELGRVLVGQEIAILEAYDDGRLDGLSERFTGLAAGTIAPAHPKTKVAGKISPTALALSPHWHPPDDLSMEDAEPLAQRLGAWTIDEVWPRTPMRYLQGRTPLDAGRAGDAVVALRAAVLQLECSHEPWNGVIDFKALRSRLGIEPEPAIDPETVDIERLHPSRLHLVPAEKLDDARLAALYQRARRYAIESVIAHSARLLVDRPEASERAGIQALSLYCDLALIDSAAGRTAEALEWIRKGRQADPAAQRTAHAPFWDMVELRVRGRSEKPETWVPDLVAVMERYDNDPQASQITLLHMMEMGLVRPMAHPERPEEVMLDTRPLQMLIAEYGPRVTTASGRLGVTAAKEGIWTPGGPAGGGGSGIWTPGAEAGGGTRGEDKPRLIIPGR